MFCFFTNQVSETRLNLQVTLTMEEKRQENPSEELDSSTLAENCQETSQNGSGPPVSVKEQRKIQINTPDCCCCVVSHVLLGYSPQAAVPKSVPTQSFSSLLPKALSAVLHPTLPPGLNSDPQPSRDPAKRTRPNLEQLQTELRDLRDQFDQMKSQHKYGFVNIITVTVTIYLVVDVPIPGCVTASVIVSVNGVFAALTWQLSCVPAKKLSCWWMSLMRRKGFAWLYRWGMKKQRESKQLECDLVLHNMTTDSFFLTGQNDFKVKILDLQLKFVVLVGWFFFVCFFASDGDSTYEEAHV